CLIDGAIGEPTMVRMELQWRAPAGAEQVGWRWDPAIAGDGLLFDLGSHGLDLLDHWFGPIETVHGFSTTRLPWSQVNDEVVGAFRFESGVLGAATWGFAGAVPRDEITITGSNGTVAVPLFDEGP